MSSTIKAKDETISYLKGLNIGVEDKYEMARAELLKYIMVQGNTNNTVPCLTDDEDELT